MEILKILLITLLAAVAIGCIVGVVMGKRAVKKALEGSKPLLTLKERLIYSGMILAGVVCIAVGIFVVGGGSEENAFMDDPDMMMGEGMMEGMEAFDTEGMDGADMDSDMLDEGGFDENAEAGDIGADTAMGEESDEQENAEVNDAEAEAATADAAGSVITSPGGASLVVVEQP